MLRMFLALPVAVLLTAQEHPEIPKNNPYTAPTDIERGRRLFQGHCASCHGPAGEGGKGANLTRPVLRRVTDDASLFRVVREGVPQTEMPGSWALNDHEAWQVAAFVRTLGRTVEETVPGDPARGKALFEGKGKCGSCHSVGSEGGVLGPVLTGVGARRSPKFLRETILMPESTLPDGFLMVSATARNGSISGIRLNEDTYSLQIRDLSGRMHSLWKSELNDIRRQKGTPMPSYRGAFSEAELDNLVAYLVSLRGEQ